MEFPEQRLPKSRGPEDQIQEAELDLVEGRWGGGLSRLDLPDSYVVGKFLLKATEATFVSGTAQVLFAHSRNRCTAQTSQGGYFCGNASFP